MPHPPSAQPKLLALSGSLRKASWSTAVMNVMVEHLQQHAQVATFPLDPLPMYNGDQEALAKAGPVGELRRAVIEADGILVVTPEYNYSIPGALKNALDWASRPAFHSGFVGKVVLPVANSVAFTGGVRVHAHLRDVVSSMLGRVVPFPEVCVGQVHTKFTDGRLTDEATRRVLYDAADALLGEVRRLVGPST